MAIDDGAERADAISLDHASRGDREAVAHLYDRHSPAMLGLASRLLGDPEDAEDLVHDVFLEAWQRAAAYEASRGSVRAWLLLRVRSRALDRLRRAQVRAAKSHAVAMHGTIEPAPAPAGEPDRAQAREALARLREPHRQVLELAYFGGLTHREIAAQCQMAEGTVKSRLSKAISELRAALGAGTLGES